MIHYVYLYANTKYPYLHISYIHICMYIHVAIEAKPNLNIWAIALYTQQRNALLN